jgi:hypothetical protein
MQICGALFWHDSMHKHLTSQTTNELNLLELSFLMDKDQLRQVLGHKSFSQNQVFRHKESQYVMVCNTGMRSINPVFML